MRTVFRGGQVIALLNMRFRSRAITFNVAVAGVVCCSVFAGCRRVEEPAVDEHSRAATPAATSPDLGPSTTASATARTSTPPPLASSDPPTQVLSLPSSAYQAALFADDDGFELLTSTAAYRLLPGKQPLQRTIDLGSAATVTRTSYVYWSQGAVWRQDRQKPQAKADKLAPLADAPQLMVANRAGDEFALLLRAADNRSAIARIEGRRVKTLYTSPGSIDALTWIDQALYFVERPAGAAWRIARIGLSGEGARFTPDKTGRWPAQLSGDKELVYYDGARRDVLRLSPDLQGEQVLARDFICSPLTVAKHVYCSTMEGIFELSGAGPRRQVVPAPRHLITALAANSERLAFISDVGAQGQDRLAVFVVPLRAEAAP